VRQACEGAAEIDIANRDLFGPFALRGGFGHRYDLIPTAAASGARLIRDYAEEPWAKRRTSTELM
jgi:hypothetical protein